MVAEQRWGDPAIWSALAELGCFGIAVPETAGGFGGGSVEIGLMMRALGRHLAIEPVAAAVVAGTLLGGTEGADDLIEALIGGEMRLAPCFDLVCGVSGVSGSARSLAGGHAAHGLLAACEQSLHLVDPADVRVTPVPLLDDTIGVDVVAEDAPSRRLEVGADWPRHRALAIARGQLARAWQALGVLEGALDATTAYMRERRQFGRPLGAFQTIQHRVAEMTVAAKEAEVAAMLGALVLDAAGPGADAERALSAATGRIAAASAIVAETAVQLHGGMGVSDELDISARFRHLQAFRFRAEAVEQPVERYAEAVVASGAHHHSAVLVEA